MQVSRSRKAFRDAVDVDDLYKMSKEGKQTKERHKTSIIKTVVDDDEYFFTCAKVYGLPFNRRCHLIICQKNTGGCYIGHAICSYGFPFYQGVHPTFQRTFKIENIAVDVQKQYLCIVKNNKIEQYFEFRVQLMIGQWIELIIRSMQGIKKGIVRQKVSQKEQHQGALKQMTETIHVLQMDKLTLKEKIAKLQQIDKEKTQASSSESTTGQKEDQQRRRVSQQTENLEQIPRQKLAEKDLKISELQSKLQSTTKEYSENKQEIQRARCQSMKSKADGGCRVNEFQAQILKFQEIVKKNEEELEAKNKILQELRKDVQQSQRQKEELTKKVEILTEQAEKKEQQCKGYQLELEKVNEENDNLSRSLKANHTQQQRLLQQVNECHRKIKSLEQNVKQSQLDLKAKEVEQRKKYEEQQFQCRLLQDENKLLKEKINQTFFHGPLLKKQNEYKNFIVSQVQAIKQRPVSETVLLYKTDPLNGTSFHKYIDRVPDIVLIVKTRAGIVFGAYSESPLEPDRKADKRSFIMSITSQKVFPVIEGKLAMIYDHHHLIFGNSEIKIRSGESKLLSNFGINNGFFNSKGGCVHDLLGEGKARQTEIEGYEVHQVIFEVE